ncbi:Phosphoribosylformylglycinamidine synthase subunit PurS [Candidatus Defluviicoccus seviourii]|mgnify:FL=1|uniref:Phosphoribosylformylglycinamidine synthase subunit PurS n=2 Tax=root TaxID=1 RepID=A0A564WA63_9PROT|nr:Phosphoribosylformylglycinamidine synthase subunit PurS [uncultured Defluviicoccus sp.]VUX45342.1 Phosphoribosylformylglycinamidine synthase subunit PurS [Candidatus Defluviicoccus seviourii]
MERGTQPVIKARVHVGLKAGVLDPQGKAVEHSLHALGFAGVHGVRTAKSFDLVLDETDPGKARTTVEAMCQQLLANTVIETYRIDIEG